MRHREACGPRVDAAWLSANRLPTGADNATRAVGAISRRPRSFPPPGITPPEQGEMAATLQDWLNEFERAQLMARLSARLRQKNND